MFFILEYLGKVLEFSFPFSVGTLHSVSYSATDSYFLQTSSKVKFITLNKKMNFILFFRVTFKVKFNVKGRVTRNRPEIKSAGALK